MHIPEEVLGERRSVNQRKMLVCKIEDLPAAHWLGCLAGARKKLVSESS